MKVFKDHFYFESIDEDLANCINSTPLIEAPSLAAHFNLNSVYLKLEGLLPFSHTFKDRGAITAISYLVKNNLNNIAFASCGNMGSAIALVAARKGIKSYALMSSEASMANIAAVNNCCANYVIYDGRFDEIDSIIANYCNLHPEIPCVNTNLIKEYEKGLRSLYYELFEEIHKQHREINIVVPTADGTLLTSLYEGYLFLKDYYPNFKVHFVLVQPNKCSPIVKAFRTGKPICRWEESLTSILSLSVMNPIINGHNALNAVIRSYGTAIDVDEEYAKTMYKVVCDCEGIMIDDVGSIVVASLNTLNQFEDLRNHPTICLLTSNGLKNLDKQLIDYASHIVSDKNEIPASLFDWL